MGRLAGQLVRIRLEEDIEVVAQVPDGRKALDAIKTRRPDICLLDIEMPALNKPSALDCDQIASLRDVWDGRRAARLRGGRIRLLSYGQKTSPARIITPLSNRTGSRPARTDPAPAGTTQ